MKDMDMGSNIGSILGAMVYQISNQTEQTHQKALNPTPLTPEEERKQKRESKRSLHSQRSKTDQAEKNVLTQFDSMLEQLQVEQGIKESNFHHVFNPDKILGNDSQSPYMQVNDENDKVVLTTDKCFVLPDGQATGMVEHKTL